MALVVVDYRAGNLRSVQRALRSVGAEFVLADRPEGVARAERLVVPGVGEARAAMDALTETGLGEAILEHARRGRPLLGICLGLQILLDRSEERDTACLGLIPGTARLFPRGGGLKVPHMGWNRVRQSRAHALFEGIPQGAYFYFVHSYYAQLRERAPVIAECDYGLRFAAGAGQDNLAAFQFHPEKSGSHGLRLLSNFLSWNPGRTA